MPLSVPFIRPGPGRQALAVLLAVLGLAAALVAAPKPAEARGLVVPAGELRLHADPTHKPFPEYSATVSRKVISKINPNDASDVRELVTFASGAACLLTAGAGAGAVVACEAAVVLYSVHINRELRKSIEQGSCFRVRALQVQRVPARFFLHANSEARLPFCVPAEGAVDTPRPLPLDRPAPVAGPVADPIRPVPHPARPAVPPRPAPVFDMRWVSQAITAMDGSPVDQMRMVPGFEYLLSMTFRVTGNTALPGAQISLGVPGDPPRPSFWHRSWPSDSRLATTGTTKMLPPGSAITFKAILTGPTAGRSYKVMLAPVWEARTWMAAEDAPWVLFGSRPDPVLTSPSLGGSSVVCPRDMLCSVPSGGTLQQPSQQPAEQPGRPPQPAQQPALAVDVRGCGSDWQGTDGPAPTHWWADGIVTSTAIVPLRVTVRAGLVYRDAHESSSREVTVVVPAHGQADWRTGDVSIPPDDAYLRREGGGCGNRVVSFSPA